MRFVHVLSLGTAAAFATPAGAQLNNLDEALRTTPITTQELAPNFHVLFGVGGSVAEGGDGLGAGGGGGCALPVELTGIQRSAPQSLAIELAQRQ